MSFTAPQDAIKTLLEDFAVCALANKKAEAQNAETTMHGFVNFDEI